MAFFNSFAWPQTGKGNEPHKQTNVHHHWLHVVNLMNNMVQLNVIALDKTQTKQKMQYQCAFLFHSFQVYSGKVYCIEQKKSNEPSFKELCEIMKLRNLLFDYKWQFHTFLAFRMKNVRRRENTIMLISTLYECVLYVPYLGCDTDIHHIDFIWFD